MSPVLKRTLQLLSLVLMQAVFLFSSAGTLDWPAGWWYLGLYVIMLAGASLVMIPRRREVIVERSKGSTGGRTWDLWITRLMMIPSLGLLVVAGLDQRLDWTPPLPLWLRVLGGFLFVGGYALVLWAMYTNTYFSQVVRIQKERGHQTVAGGPCRLVRHPGYLGMIISFLGAVFLLDTLYGLACFTVYLILIILRTRLEDRTLHGELPGYPEYAAQTRFRLVPGLW